VSGSRSDVVIIGSGISALTSAAILARKGKKVRVLEQYNKPGGYLHCFSRFGTRFDTGAHYVGAMDPGQPFHTLLSYVGAYDERLFVPLEKDGFDVLSFPEFSVELPKGYSETIRRLATLFPGEAGAIERYYSQVREVAVNFPTYEFRETTDMGFVARVLETPLESVVMGLTSNRDLQSVLMSYCTLHGVRPADVSFGMHAIVTDSLVRGPYGLTQGGDGLARSYVAAIEAAGGEVLLKRKCERIEVVDRIAKAVVTSDGERHEADWVISSAHPKATFALVSDPKAFTPAFRDRVSRIRETDGIFGIYAACPTPPALNPLKNYYYFRTADPADMLECREPGLPPNAIFLSPAERAPGPGAPKTTGLNIHAVGPMPWFEPWRDSRYGKRPDEYEAFKKSYAEQVFTLIDRFDPGIRRSVDRYASSSPVTNLHFNGSPEGSPYGIYHSIQNTGARALGPRTHVANLLLTGQSCLFPGLLGAAISGLRTSGHIVGIKPILAELASMAEAGK
jgi:all-trans-retinol 13,14-reductase